MVLFVKENMNFRHMPENWHHVNITRTKRKDIKGRRLKLLYNCAFAAELCYCIC